MCKFKKTDYHQILLIEGNPYNTKHNIGRKAIKGALLSISLSWQIPILFSSNADDSVQTLILAARQNLQEKFMFHRTGYKPKTGIKRQVYFLQDLPSVGPKIANEILKKFGSIERIISATEKELQNVAGIGSGKAKAIKSFIISKFSGMSETK